MENEEKKTTEDKKAEKLTRKQKKQLRKEQDTAASKAPDDADSAKAASDADKPSDISKPSDTSESKSSADDPKPQPEKHKTLAALRSAAVGKITRSSPAKGADGDDDAEKTDDDNFITIELPDSQASKLGTHNPEPTASKPDKPELTPEEIAARGRRRRLAASRTADIVLLILTLIGGALMLLPIVFALCQSFKSSAELQAAGQHFLPEVMSSEAYSSLLMSEGSTGVPFYRFMFNTLFIAVIVTFVQAPITVGAAYALAKTRAPMIKTLNRLVELSLAFTPAAAYVSNYLLMSKTMMTNTYFALILPFIASPLALVLIRQFIRTIPDDDICAAQLEGASHVFILRKLIIPRIKPAIAAAALLTFTGMGKLTGQALVFSEELKPLPSYMDQLSGRGAIGEMYALAALMLIPPAILLIIFRKSMAQAMSCAGLKE